MLLICSRSFLRCLCRSSRDIQYKPRDLAVQANYPQRDCTSCTPRLLTFVPPNLQNLEPVVHDTGDDSEAGASSFQVSGRVGCWVEKHFKIDFELLEALFASR
jgi:hypothetical protein